MNEKENKNDLTRSTETRNPAGASIGMCGARGPRKNAGNPERSEGVSAIARNAAFYGESNVVTAPIMQSATSKLEPETPVNPLDDLASAVDDFKTRLRAMFDESTMLSRKVKEVALVQKQKERDFVLARRAIERIRMAI